MKANLRLYRIDRILREQGFATFAGLMSALEVSRATLKRDLASLRDDYNAPLEYDRAAGGYRYGRPRTGPRFQLPGLWFSADEALALLTMHQLLQSIDAGGLLGSRLKPLTDQLTRALGRDEAAARETLRRVRLLPAQQLRVRPAWFEIVGRALTSRRRLRIDYYSRSRDARGLREVSPQRMVHYRGNWYLDAWCHRSEAVRMFAFDSIADAVLLDERARDVPMREVDEQTARGYGIWRGTALKTAELHFNAEAARWVRDELWHPKQQGTALPDGGWSLQVPYTGSPELEMDILRHGQNVVVVGPPELRERILARLAAAVRGYGDGGAAAPS